MSNTEEADYAFVVKEGVGGIPWIVCEPRTRRLSIVGRDGLLGFRLREGVSLKEAEGIAKFLEANIAAILFADLSEVPSAGSK